MPPPAGKPRQIVYYDNGVGTENFKPLAALGGAFGIGVWKNVPDEPSIGLPAEPWPA